MNFQTIFLFFLSEAIVNLRHDSFSSETTDDEYDKDDYDDPDTD